MGIGCESSNNCGDFADSCEVESTTLEEVLQLLPVAWSSIGRIDQPPSCTDFVETAISVLKFWSNVFKDPENKDFVKFLGQTLYSYANILMHQSEQ